LKSQGKTGTFWPEAWKKEQPGGLLRKNQYGQRMKTAKPSNFNGHSHERDSI
jgi:hypothetical protein